MNARSFLFVFRIAMFVLIFLSPIYPNDIKAGQAIAANSQPDQNSQLVSNALPTLTGLTFWLQAGAGVTLNGTQVSEWVDQSGSGLVVTQTEPSQQPAFIEQGGCNTPAIGFDGGDFLFKGDVPGTSLFSNSNSTSFLVLKQTSNPHNNTYLGWLDVYREGYNRFLIQEASSDNTLHFQLGDPNWPNGGDLSGQEPGNWENVWKVLTVTRNGNDGMIRVNGMNLPLLTQFSTPGDNTGTGNFWIGSDIWGNNFEGEIAEIIVYNTSLSESEIISTEEQLMDKVCIKYQGVFLDGQTLNGVPGQVVNYQATVVNKTGGEDSFTLQLGTHAWSTNLSSTTLGPIENGASATFTLSVSIPQDALQDAADTVEVTATSVSNPSAYFVSALFTTKTLPAPVADFGYWPSEPNVFEDIWFWQNSYDPAGNYIQSVDWNFGDGSTSHDWYPSHRYNVDGNFTVQLTVTTSDGRVGTISKVIQVRMHDIAITKFRVPENASLGQTKTITVSIENKRYPETVQVDLYKSTPWGFEQIATLTKTVPVTRDDQTITFSFSYVATPDDATYKKVTFKAVATITTARDAMPYDNEVILFPTRISE